VRIGRHEINFDFRKRVYAFNAHPANLLAYYYEFPRNTRIIFRASPHTSNVIKTVQYGMEYYQIRCERNVS